MVTMVGKERDTIDLLKNLIELDYDAIEAYDAAIHRIEDDGDRAQLLRFRADHERHVHELSRALETLGEIPPKGADLKSILTKGKVVLLGLAGDHAILVAMKTNEDDTNTAYERAASRRLASPFGEIIDRGLADERRHRAWIRARLGSAEDVLQT